MPPLKILIVGAGPVGLCAALDLAQRGHQVDVVEKYEKISTQGGCLQMAPNATRLLYRLGLRDDVQKCAENQKSYSLWKYDNEEELITVQLAGMYPEPTALISRSDLSNMLFKHATKAGAKVHFGKKVVAVDEKEPSISFADGSSKMTADLLICADGIKSICQKAVFPSGDLQPLVTDECCFQTDIPFSELADPYCKEFCTSQGIHLFLGPGRFVVSWPMPEAQLYSAIFVDRNHGPPGDINVWNGAGDIEDPRERFSKFGPFIQRVLEKMTSCDKWQIAEGPVLPSWSSASGRVVLIGDSAHAMIPHTGQGCAQGIEDAMALAEILSHIKTTDQIPRATAVLEEFRRPRADWLKERARGNADGWALEDGPAADGRNAQLKAQGKAMPPSVDMSTVKADKEAPLGAPAFMKWQSKCFQGSMYDPAV